jgi:hypothetical protein
MSPSNPINKLTSYTFIPFNIVVSQLLFWGGLFPWGIATKDLGAGTAKRKSEVLHFAPLALTHYLFPTLVITLHLMKVAITGQVKLQSSSDDQHTKYSNYLHGAEYCFRHIQSLSWTTLWSTSVLFPSTQLRYTPQHPVTIYSPAPSYDILASTQLRYTPHHPVTIYSPAPSYDILPSTQLRYTPQHPVFKHHKSMFIP